MKTPPYLVAGDTVYLSSPAKAVDEASLLKTKGILEAWGLKVLFAPHVLGRHHYFSGTDEERCADFQWGLDSPEIKAILCTRGGYGCVRIVNQLNWDRFIANPKWIIGFSDVTVFHQKVNRLGYQSIHGIMPLGFSEGTEASRQTMKQALFGDSYVLEAPSGPNNVLGEATGTLIGGNMTILYSLLATDLSYSFSDKILFLEDIGEHLYKIDRMLYAFEMTGVFNELKGLVLGGFTELEDTDVPFGQEVSALILARVERLGIPVAFDFPIGHIADNQALTLGKRVHLSVSSSMSRLLI